MPLVINIYSERGFSVRGDTKPHAEKFKEMGGRYNPHLKDGPGWVFSIKHRLATVKAYVDCVNKKVNGNMFIKGLQKRIEDAKHPPPSRKRKEMTDAGDRVPLKLWKRKKIEEFKKESDSILEKERHNLELDFQRRRLELEDMFEQDRKRMEQEFDLRLHDLESKYEDYYTESFIQSTYSPRVNPPKKIRVNTLWAIVTIMSIFVASIAAIHYKTSILSEIAKKALGQFCLKNMTELSVQRVMQSGSLAWNRSITKMNEQIIPTVTDRLNHTMYFGIYHGTETFSKIKSLASW